MSGLKLRRDFAKRVLTTVERSEKQANDQTPILPAKTAVRRQARFYKTTEGPMPEPAGLDQPSSVECTLMKFDGTTLTETTTKELVYSRRAIDADEIFRVTNVGGRPFADEGVSTREFDIYFTLKSGMNGTKSSPNTYLYTVFDDYERTNQIADDVNIQHGNTVHEYESYERSNCDPAKWGRALWDGSTLIVLYANERLRINDCTA